MALATWYYVVTTYSSSSVESLYLNGVLVHQLQHSSTIKAAAEILTIGSGSGSDAPENFFDGRIGGAFVSATAMTEREVKAEYQRGLRRINSTIDANDTISDNDIAAIAVDPAGNYVTVMGDDKAVPTAQEKMQRMQLEWQTHVKLEGREVAELRRTANEHYVLLHQYEDEERAVAQGGPQPRRNRRTR